MKTSEIFLMWNTSQGAFEFKQNENARSIILVEAQLQAALNNIKGTAEGDVLAFLIDTAKGSPDKWHSASNSPLKPGQGVIG